MNSVDTFNDFFPLLQLELYTDNNENLNFDIKFCFNFKRTVLFYRNISYLLHVATKLTNQANNRSFIPSTDVIQVKLAHRRPQVCWSDNHSLELPK